MSGGEYPSAPICAVGVVIIHEGQVLLAQRGQSPGEGSWTVPGGRVEIGETLEQAARREIEEELGIAVDLGGVLDAVNVIMPDGEGRVRFHYVVVDLLGVNPRGQVRAGSDVRDARWVGPLELGPLKVPLRTQQVIARGFQAAAVRRDDPSASPDLAENTGGSGAGADRW